MLGGRSTYCELPFKFTALPNLPLTLVALFMKMAADRPKPEESAAVAKFVSSNL